MRLAAVDEADLDVAVVRARPAAPSVARRARRRLLAADDGDELATAGQQARDHLEGHLGEVGADDDDVAADGAEDVTRLAAARHW